MSNEWNALSKAVEMLDEEEREKVKLYLYSLKKMAEDNVEGQKSFMTDLYNLRALFFKAGELMRNHPERKHALIQMDIDNFKSFNEFCGRDGGDLLLQSIADAMRGLEREDRVLCHFRADVFEIFTSFESEEELVDITKYLTSKIAQVKLPCKAFPSFGIYVAEDPGVPVSFMKDYADMAMRTIKGKFYSNYAFFDEEMRTSMLKEKQIENQAVEALEKGQFQVYIQPKVNMETGAIIGGEALIRWKHPEYGMISPMDFIPVIEKDGFIINVDVYVWNEVFKMLGRRQAAGKKVVPISVNISRLHAHQDDMVKCIRGMGTQYGVSPEMVGLEVTESGFSNNTTVLFERMQQLRDFGFPVHMDDFGKGHSTLTMLKNEPVDVIKLDRDFLRQIENAKNQVVVKNTIGMLNALDVHVIAEGVETQEQADFLIQCGCYDAQGFYYYRPMPMGEFEALLDEEQAKSGHVVKSI